MTRASLDAAIATLIMELRDDFRSRRHWPDVLPDVPRRHCRSYIRAIRILRAVHRSHDRSVR